MRLAAALTLLILLPLPGSAQDRFTRATDIGQVDSVWSAVLDESRPYLVYTPPSYDDATVTPQRYPVLYLLDGDAHFHSVSGLIQILGTGVNGTYAIPEMIVVAIPNTDRMRDMTPTHTETLFDGTAAPGMETSGGMPAFFDFLQSELIPKIEAEYRTMPYRVFVGHSLGGITTLNALYTIPEAFDAYVAIDPSLWWDKQTLLWQAKDYFSSARLDGKALYMAQANTINAADTARNLHFESITHFNAVMESYNESGLRYSFRYYDQDDHGSVPLIAEYDALRFIFEGYKVPLVRVLDRPSLLTEHFQDVSARLGAPFQPTESMVRLLAQVSMGQDTTKAKAIELGEMRTRLFPQSAGAEEFLGDTWASKGDTEKARAHYQQALAKMGDRERIEEKIGKLGG